MAVKLFSKLFRGIRSRKNSLAQAAPVLLRSTDVLVASYPRSGNTWLRLLLSDLILQNAGFKTETDLPVHQDRIIPDLDRRDDLNPADEAGMDFRIIKTHQKYESQFGKAIVLFRQPVDALVSHYHFMLRYPETCHLADQGVDAFCIRQMTEWSSHLESFLNTAGSRSCQSFFIAYEKLHLQPESVMRQLGDFLNLDFKTASIQRAIENHTFEKLFRNETSKDGTPERFFRKGRIGSGKAELDRQTFESIEQHCQPLYAAAYALIDDKNSSTRLDEKAA